MKGLNMLAVIIATSLTILGVLLMWIRLRTVENENAFLNQQLDMRERSVGHVQVKDASVRTTGEDERHFWVQVQNQYGHYQMWRLPASDVQKAITSAENNAADCPFIPYRSI